MRVIISGAGLVGYSIAAYLSSENNDVTVIDQDPSTISRINSELDANGILGSASNPAILQSAGAEEADMVIAVTQNDEVNMVCCQVAHSLFNVPKKIARVKNQIFREPEWANLFSRSHMPIDVIISPELEIAKAIEKRLSVPGATSVIPLSDNHLYFCGVYCEASCPLLNTQLIQLQTLFPDLKAQLVMIVRNGQAFIPSGNDQLLEGDDVYFVCEKDHLERVLNGFGYENQTARNIIIVGGGNVGLSLVQRLQDSSTDYNIKIIEKDSDRAQYLSDLLEEVTILNASSLNRNILEEANIEKTETLIAVTDSDETNILTALLANQYGCDRVVPLVNKNAYDGLTSSIGVGAIISPKAITVSTVMRHIRKGRIKAAHNIPGNFAEILEIEASDKLAFLNQPISEIHFPSGVVICAIERNDEVIIPTKDTVIKANDIIILLAMQGTVQKLESMFTPNIELF